MNDPIRLGLMAPLTGLVSLYGPEIERAARLAVATINESGGVLGRPLDLVVADDGSMPEPALAAARALVDQGCAALIGNLLSNARIAVADQVATPGEIPLLNFSFYEGSISSPWFFNFAALPNQQIDRMIPTMVDMGGPKMYFAGNNYEWPRGSIDAAKRALVAAGGEVLDEVYLPIGADPADIADLVADVGRSGADVFVPYFAGQDQINLLNAFGEAGLKSRMDVVMGHYDEAMVAALSPEVREGLFSVNTYFMAIDNPVNRRTLARLAAETGGLWPEGPGVMTNFGEGAHVCVLAFAAAVAAAGGVAPAALAEALTHVRVDAPQGLVIMDPATRHAAVNAWLARCHADGSFSIVTEFGRIAPEIPERYRTVPGADPVAAEPLCPLPRPAPDLDLDGLFGPIIDLPDLAVVATDATGRILRTNAGAAELFGYHQAEMVGMSVHLLVPPHLRSRHGQAMARFAQGAATHIRMGSRGEISGYRKDGTMFPAQASLSRFTIAKAPVLVATLRDISERKQAEADLMWRATHDPLTGLPNRTLLRERLNNALERSARSGQDVILMFIDLDNFKLVNDTLGHESGDRLLVRVAETLLAVVRPGDIVARLGGDEFVVLCTEVDSTSRITHLAERINDALRLPMTCDGREVVTTASIGIARGVGGVDRGDDLLRNADAAMYLSKERGRDSWHEFSDDLHETAQRKLQILSGLRTAIERDQFDLVYQPILACGSQRILGAEALLRWTGPDGPVSPGVFIPVAEQAGLIAPIGRWVFDAACATLAGWLDRFGPDGPYVSVNLSVDQLNVPGLIDDFAGILDHHQVPPSRILLEVTETSLMTDIDRNLATLRALNDLGLVLAVDDFGTGYSSLLQLLRLPVDTLKIDREFVDGLDKREDSRQVVAAIVRMARSLRKRVIAEGVETEAQGAHLRDLGCDGVQGFLFHRPMSAGAFADLLDRRSPSDGDGRGEIHMAIYASRAIAPLTHDDLHHLLEVARQQNRRNGITGLLIYRDGRFLQYLEGPEEKLDDLLAVIAADRRHTDMRIVDRQPLASRLFGDWSMGAWQPHFGGASLDLDQLANNVPMCRTVFEALAQRR